MQTCDNIEQLRSKIKAWRASNESIAFVPTMGNLHNGHISLVELARKRAQHVVVSIYVNPLQFAPHEDFDSYPRTLQDDLDKLATVDTELVFTPDTSLVYPQGERENTFVEVPRLSDILEGEFRPGFFRGVATIVLKLFNMVQPDIAVFGEKDYQQLLVIRRMVEELNLPIEIIGAPIIREADGLAMSSRNGYLDEDERASSRVLSETLAAFCNQIKLGVSVEEAEHEAVQKLQSQGFGVDYVSLREASELRQIATDELKKVPELVVLAAAKLGSTRLIDNMKFTLSD
jgi:pantoate--beta-alanine ligase